MPVSRTIRASRQAAYSTTNTLLMAGQRHGVSGPLVCSDIANNGQVELRQGIKAALLLEAERVAGAYPKGREDCSSKGHKLCKPFICLGLKNPADFG